jgi:hypothetical protein
MFSGNLLRWHYLVRQVQTPCLCKPQTTLTSLVSFTKVKDHVLTEQTAPLLQSTCRVITCACPLILTPSNASVLHAPDCGSFYWILNCGTRTRRFWRRESIQTLCGIITQLQNASYLAAEPRCEPASEQVVCVCACVCDLETNWKMRRIIENNYSKSYFFQLCAVKEKLSLTVIANVD